MIRIVRTNEENPDFLRLIEMLDAYLARVDGADHAYYAHLNTLDVPRNVVLAYSNGGAVGCGAVRPLEGGRVEIKRMYVLPGWRRKGIAGLILAELESWAREFSAAACVLETGRQQPEAIALYTRHGYQQIPNFAPFTGIRNSVCFHKDLR